MLIVKSVVNGKTAAESKKTILGNMKTPIEAVNKTKDGHFAVRFTNKRNLEAAREELEKENENENVISVSEKGKMKPNIKIANVSKDDDNVTESIKIKNEQIANLIVDEEDLILKETEQARNKKLHYIYYKMFPLNKKGHF